MSEKYILDGKEPIPCDDLLTWARWIEDSEKKIVARTHFGPILVSTVFLGIDHQFGEGPPLLFETMVFGDKNHDVCERCSTWEEAEAQHAKVCELLEAK